MSKLMWIAGILLIAASIALGLMFFVSTASVASWLNFETVIILAVGGILALGMGSVVSGLDRLAEVNSARVDTDMPAAVVPAAVVPAPVTAIPEFGRRQSEPPAAAPTADTVVAAAVAPVAADVVADVSQPTRETLQALEQARQKIEQAFEPKPDAEVPVAEAAALPEVAVEEEAPVEDLPADEEAELAEGQLYVVEEKTVRNRPARILSDGTVEAETEEGWMRFENLEHLDEYLDAMAPSRA